MVNEKQDGERGNGDILLFQEEVAEGRRRTWTENGVPCGTNKRELNAKRKK
jgi:hypothetical protein